MDNNILTYLKQTLPAISAVNPFNEVDAFVLSAFAYLPHGADVRGEHSFTDINPKELTISEFCHRLLNQGFEILKARFGSSGEKEFTEMLALCRLLEKNQRYGNLRIINNKFNNSYLCQFAAYTVELISNKAYAICFRGTDGTFEGWREDFQLVNEDIPSHYEARAYTDADISSYSKADFYLMGHSKGGNLAIYAATCATEKSRSCMKAIYNFDGPGFSAEFLESHLLPVFKVRSKVRAYYIENSIIGQLLKGQTLFCLPENRFYVKANPRAILLMQHSCFEWIIIDGSFEYGSESFISVLLNRKIDEIINSVDSDQLSDYFKRIFDVLRKIKGDEVKQEFESNPIFK